MKPVTKDRAEEPTETKQPTETDKPTPTKAPDTESDWDWEASEADFESLAGNELMPGLTQLFDNTSTNKTYITGTVNGEYDEETSEKPTMLKFEPTQDGVLTVKIKDVEKTAVIIEKGTKEDASAVTPPSKQDVTVTRNVEAGKTYYVTVKGSKARFAAAKFTAQAIPKSYSWAASADSINNTPAGTELIPGLTTLFDNTSTSNKYISSGENGAIDKEGNVSGTALKYEATVDGVLTVTVIDLGVDKTVVIYDSTDAEDVYTHTTTVDKETVVATAEVVAGHTYYVVPKGTKGRFSAASFTSKVD